jgi:hypothetical protein
VKSPSEHRGYRYNPEVCQLSEVEWFANRETTHAFLPSWHMRDHNQRCLDHLSRVRSDPRWYQRDERRKR